MTDPQIPKQPVAVIGLGAMGMAMSRVLLKASWPLVGVDVRPEQLQEIAAHGARTAQNPAEAASLAKLFLLMVVNDAQCEEVLFGEQGLLQAMTPGSVVINCATVPPLFARNTGSRLEKNGMHYLDAPVSGGTKGAWNGALSVMAAGSDQALEASQAVLQVLSKQIYHLGHEIGQGSYMKMINQLLVGVHIVSAAEAMALAVRCGLDPETIYEIITNSAGNSWSFGDRVPRMLDADCPVESAIDIFVKDLGIVQETARELNYPLPLSAIALQQFLQASASGLGRADDSSVIRNYPGINPGKSQ